MSAPSSFRRVAKSVSAIVLEGFRAATRGLSVVSTATAGALEAEGAIAAQCRAAGKRGEERRQQQRVGRRWRRAAAAAAAAGHIRELGGDSARPIGSTLPADRR
jgi:hypothetical protein